MIADVNVEKGRRSPAPGAAFVACDVREEDQARRPRGAAATAACACACAARDGFCAEDRRRAARTLEPFAVIAST